MTASLEIKHRIPIHTIIGHCEKCKGSEFRHEPLVQVSWSSDEKSLYCYKCKILYVLESKC